MTYHPTLMTPEFEPIGGFADPDVAQTDGAFICPCGVTVIAAHSVHAPGLPIWITPDADGAWTLTATAAARFLPAAERQTAAAAQRYGLHYPDCPGAVQARRVERERREAAQARRRHEGDGT